MGVPPAAGSAATLGPPSSPPPPWSPPAQQDSAAWHKSRDPRSSSTQSLLPSLRDQEDRRVLLIVYIHGFMGNNTSFRSFPAHVHNYLKDALADSHVIHSKVYPRYKTYKAIDVARDNLSKWLEPHESETTDVVLVGHSMGGLLAADLALMPSPNPVYGGPFKHRILGTISLDAPLLGLHPGIIKSGLASLFRKAPDPPGKQQELADSQASQHASSSLSLDDRPGFSSDVALSSGVASPAPLTTTSSNTSGLSQWPDPNFNPTFFNDVQFVDRGWWRNMAHFAKKHYSEGIFTSAYQHLLSHLEFGGCLADYSGLNNRYNRLRRLEDVDELNSGDASGRREPRIRFVNYYTISTGIPKTPAPPPAPKRADTHLRPVPPASQPSAGPQSGASTPRISIDDYSDSENVQPLEVLDPVPEPDSDPEDKPKPPGSESVAKPGDSGGHDTHQGGGESATSASAAEPHTNGDGLDELENGLPAIPPIPEPPEAPDFERYTDKDARKQAEKEFKRVQKTYDQAVKNRDKAIKERQKLVEKRRKKAQKEVEKRAKEEEKRIAKEQQQQQKEANKAAAAAAKEDSQQQQQEKAEESDDATAAADKPSSPSRAQVVTPAQTQALQEQLTDLALQESATTASSSPVSPPPTTAATTTTRTTTDNNNKAPKLRKFCMLPPKANDGGRDPAWVQVYMEGVDEVGAHCGLFFAGPHYEKLVGDVGGRVVGWVQEDLTKRTILAMR